MNLMFIECLGLKKLESNETLYEYLYSLMKLGTPIQLNDERLMKYFTNGIPDSKQNKTVLFQSQSISELKMLMCIKNYVRIHTRRTKCIHHSHCARRIQHN